MRDAILDPQSLFTAIVQAIATGCFGGKQALASLFLFDRESGELELWAHDIPNTSDVSFEQRVDNYGITIFCTTS